MQSDWEGRVIARLSVMPNEATPLQRAQLLAAFAVGSEIIHLRHVMHHVRSWRPTSMRRLQG